MYVYAEDQNRKVLFVFCTFVVDVVTTGFRGVEFSLVVMVVGVVCWAGAGLI